MSSQGKSSLKQASAWRWGEKKPVFQQTETPNKARLRMNTPSYAFALICMLAWVLSWHAVQSVGHGIYWGVLFYTSPKYRIHLEDNYNAKYHNLECDNKGFEYI